MARTNTLTNYLTDVAQAIKDKKGDQTPIQASDFDTEIENLPSSGDLSEYFESTITGGTTSEPGWMLSIKKMPSFQMIGTSSSYMFYRYFGKALDLVDVDTTNITNMRFMFMYCSHLISLDLSSFDTSNVTGMTSMFEANSSLITLNLSSFNFEKIKGGSSNYGINNMFKDCTNLKDLTFGINLGKGYNASSHNSYLRFDLSTCTLLTHDSLMSVINNLYDLTGKNTQDLILGATNLAKISSSELAIATSKNWTVS